jgi:hypothetical protein
MRVLSVQEAQVRVLVLRLPEVCLELLQLRVCRIAPAHKLHVQLIDLLWWSVRGIQVFMVVGVWPSSHVHAVGLYDLLTLTRRALSLRRGSAFCSQEASSGFPFIL